MSESKQYLYKEDGFEINAQFNKSLQIATSQHDLTYGLSYLTRDIENTNITHYIKSDNSTGSKTIQILP